MNTKDYNNLKKEKNVFGHDSLNITLKELKAKNNSELVSEIERILQNNRIEKPALHSSPNEQSLDFYTVDLSQNQISEIVAIFLELEANSVNEKGEGNSLSSFYASLVDEWNRQINY